MGTSGNFHQLLKRGSPAIVVAGVLLSLAAFGRAQATKDAPKQEAQLMFVQVAEDLKVDAATHTLRLVKVNQQTLYFSDRPVRIAGHIKMSEYLDEWTPKAGKDSFTADPPNAVLSVYEPGQDDSTLAVVEITHPRVDGADLLYSYKVVKGKLPASGGQTALFIDAIGVGGGVGAGFHGAGVGARGAGVRR
jgi:hypothetical protein